ncbi:MAG: glycosyl hydrolase, partial [Myxococcota bacterium]
MKALLAIPSAALIAASLAACGGDPVARPFDWCSQNAPPDSDCWAGKRDPASANVMLARAIADKEIAGHPDPAALNWDWGEAVMMYGLTQLYKVTG